jgi:hypothetical protein
LRKDPGSKLTTRVTADVNTPRSLELATIGKAMSIQWVATAAVVRNIWISLKSRRAGQRTLVRADLESLPHKCESLLRHSHLLLDLQPILTCGRARISAFNIVTDDT